MLRTVAVLIAGELYLLPVPAEPVRADVPELAEVKAMLAQHSDDASGVCGALCVDFGAKGQFKIAGDGGNDICLSVATDVMNVLQNTGQTASLPSGNEPCPLTSTQGNTGTHPSSRKRAT